MVIPRRFYGLDAFDDGDGAGSENHLRLDPAFAKASARQAAATAFAKASARQAAATAFAKASARRARSDNFRR